MNRGPERRVGAAPARVNRRAGAAGDRRWARAPRWPWPTIAWAVLAAFVGLQAYVLLHLLGHALAAWSVGLHVIAIEPWWFDSPRTRWAGDRDGARGAWVAMAGVTVPWLLALAAFAVARPRRPLWRWAAVVVATFVLGSLLPWVAIPALGLQAPAADVTNFLQRSGLPPGVVAGAALLALLAFTLVALRALGGARAAARSVTAVVGAGRRPVAWAVLLPIAVAVGAASFAVGAVGRGDAGPQPPRGFTLAADLRFPGGLVDEGVAGDTALTAHRLEVWVEVRDVTDTLRVDLVGPGGERTSVLALGPGSKVGIGSARTPPIELPRGPWAIHASAAPSDGRLVVGWRYEPLR